jgi:hypothetical protein
MTMQHSEFGGDDKKFAPRWNSCIDCRPMYLMDCAPDFSVPPGQCQPIAPPPDDGGDPPVDGGGETEP